MSESNEFIVASSSPQSPSFPSLFDTFGSSGHSPVLIAAVGIRWAISTVGTVLNLLLVWVTIRNKSLHGTCNFFIAFDALSAALYQSSNSIPMFIVLSGVNFIPLHLCLHLMAYAILAITLSLCAIFLIGFDRLLSVLFPILNEKCKLFVCCSLTLSMAYSLYVLWQCWAVGMAIPNTPVMCSISDCFPNEAGHMLFRNSMIIIGLSSLNYLIIWVGLKWKSANLNTGKASRSFTEKIFKSLIVIMGKVLFGWMMNATARFLLPKFTFTPLEIFYISTALGCITNFVLASNGPVLYAFSKDYRKAFLNFYYGVEPSGYGSGAWIPERLGGSIRKQSTVVRMAQ